MSDNLHLEGERCQCGHPWVTHRISESEEVSCLTGECDCVGGTSAEGLEIRYGRYRLGSYWEAEMSAKAAVAAAAHRKTESIRAIRREQSRPVGTRRQPDFYDYKLLPFCPDCSLDRPGSAGCWEWDGEYWLAYREYTCEEDCECDCHSIALA